MDEFWKDIPGFPNYQISNLGRVKRLKLVQPHPRNPNKTRTYSEKIKKNTFSRSNGWVVGLSAGRVETVARLLLTAFIRPPAKDEIARHLDDDKHNQSLENLAWGTHKDNMEDSGRNGRRAVGSRLPISKLSEEKVLKIRELYTPNRRRKSGLGYNVLGRQFGVTGESIAAVIKGQTWTHVKGE